MGKHREQREVVGVDGGDDQERVDDPVAGGGLAERAEEEEVSRDHEHHRQRVGSRLLGESDLERIRGQHAAAASPAQVPPIRRPTSPIKGIDDHPQQHRQRADRGLRRPEQADPGQVQQDEGRVGLVKGRAPHEGGDRFQREALDADGIELVTVEGRPAEVMEPEDRAEDHERRQAPPRTGHVPARKHLKKSSLCSRCLPYLFDRRAAEGRTVRCTSACPMTEARGARARDRQVARRNQGLEGAILQHGNEHTRFPGLERGPERGGQLLLVDLVQEAP